MFLLVFCLMNNQNIFLLESKNDSLLPIAIILEMHGCHTVLASNEEECHGRPVNLNDAPAAVDLLITDMPAHILKGFNFGPIPVLVIVNPEYTGAMNVIREKGFQYLEKPVEPLLLLTKTAAILQGM
jgi:hypothetical protein